MPGPANFYVTPILGVPPLRDVDGSATFLTFGAALGTVAASGYVRLPTLANNVIINGHNGGGDAQVVTISGALVRFGDNNAASGWTTTVDGFTTNIQARTGTNYYANAHLFGDFTTATTNLLITPGPATCSFLFGQAVAVTIGQTIRSGDNPTNNFVVQAQGASSTSTGTNRNGARLELVGGEPISGAAGERGGFMAGFGQFGGTRNPMIEAFSANTNTRRTLWLAKLGNATDLGANTGDGVVVIAPATTYPTAVVASATAAVIAYNSATSRLGFFIGIAAGGNSIELDGTTAAAANTGASGAPPAQVAGYLNVYIGGTQRKVPFYVV